MPTKKRRVTTDIGTSLKMNLACRNQRLPCTGVLDATPHGTFGCGQTDRALLRTRHSLLCWERGWRSYRPGQINLRLTALGSHSEAYRERGISNFLAAAGQELGFLLRHSGDGLGAP